MWFEFGSFSGWCGALLSAARDHGSRASAAHLAESALSASNIHCVFPTRRHRLGQSLSLGLRVTLTDISNNKTVLWFKCNRFWIFYPLISQRRWVFFYFFYFNRVHCECCLNVRLSNGSTTSRQTDRPPCYLYYHTDKRWVLSKLLPTGYYSHLHRHLFLFFLLSINNYQWQTNHISDSVMYIFLANHR